MRIHLVAQSGSVSMRADSGAPNAALHEIAAVFERIDKRL
jgi:hypothetical protein